MPDARNMDPPLTATGRLQVGAFDIDIGMPAANATIRVTQTANPDVVMEELITDDSGQTVVIELPAPPMELSLTPQEVAQPYSEYDIRVTLQGYRPIDIVGVQVLPDTTAYQDVRLTPETNLGADTQTIHILPNTLWGTFPPKIPEDPVKPLPPSGGFVVLSQAVIPEYIIVHAGVPSDATAPNYWVPFKDYIKNVASCEIYSTWPEQTIIANVLAILSFTLNRVFTEWYRGKGYNFTITNSTAYDHAFVYKRNIFESISRVVDDIFTTFMTKPDIRQPLFSQYCDGNRVQCPNWMTQWGSKQLGDQGYDAISILRSFYGNDVYLVTANKVAGIPSSFPGTNLQVGSRGPAVRTIQEQLNAISNNYPAINKIRVDGAFGEQTRRAVQTFQQIFRMPASGIVDFPTWYRISDVYVAVTRMAELT